MIHIIKILLIINSITAECPFKEKSYSETVTITNFNNLSELSFNECKNELIMLTDWKLKPNKKLILDNTLNFKGLTIIPKNKLIFIQLINFKGFDLLSHPFNDIYFVDYSLKYVSWNIKSSHFDFFINNKKLTGEQDCLNNNNTLWNNFILNSYLNILIINEGTLYSLKTCPLIFKNTIISELAFKEIKSSFINSNILTFLKLKNNSNYHLNSYILHVEFSLYRIHFDDNLLNEEIFKKTKCLDLQGILNGIQYDLFKSFNYLKLIRIHTQHVKQLFSTNNNKWFEYLNYKMPPIDPDDAEKFLDKAIFLIIYQSFSTITFYNYPNEDFCLFMKFPHNKLVFPQLRPSHMNCRKKTSSNYIIAKLMNNLFKLIKIYLIYL